MLSGLFAGTAYGAPALQGHLHVVLFNSVQAGSAPAAMGRGHLHYSTDPEPGHPVDVLGEFLFLNLTPITAYSVVAPNGIDTNADQQPEIRALCDFTTDNAGRGTCATVFTTDKHLPLLELRRGGADGMTVLTQGVGDPNAPVPNP
jgi:hypothetical protein